jgi:hypothetical protein
MQCFKKYFQKKKKRSMLPSSARFFWWLRIAKRLWLKYGAKTIMENKQDKNENMTMIDLVFVSL